MTSERFRSGEIFASHWPFAMRRSGGYGRSSFLRCPAASSPSIGAPKVQQPAREAYDRKIRLLEHVFETRSQDEAQLRSLYTHDAVLVEASGNEIHGREQIVAAFRKVLASGAVAHFRATTAAFRSSGSSS